MTNKEIQELMDRFERGSIRSLRLAKGDFSLEMSKDGAMPATSAPPVPAAGGAHAQQEEPAPACETINAPLAGMFYVASAPDAEPFVRVGDRVRQGDTVCLMEAMKMISEVPAPCDCIITKAYKENGCLAGFGEPLFGYTPC